MMRASRRISEGHYDERVDLPGGTLGMQRDELGELALTFNQMASKLQHIEERRTQLLADVAHELRTPLTTIQGSMEGLMDGVFPAEAEVFQTVHREAARLENLVRDLQVLSRAESGASHFILRRYSLWTWSNGSVHSWSVSTRKTGSTDRGCAG